ncbi:uncharacterized protein F4812DRAFT_10013 [Daldinia caldariorum]|uniref:uncharacterized protein n=1 Tax=Daldinia caldariorum TaxID=326644 RepID=UPI002007A766|nr:uncharacterized protein F4812DRAFT_10013 [Daldinia caldariorum]KAI1472347.1 hypothetical protein F4812DRAFT_10013 [Daldinia caldariorum]
MKYSFTLVTLAAGISQVTATGFFGFHNAPQFSCPDNTDNVCIPDIVKGIDWSDLPFGGFDSYKGFKWSGFTCGEKFGKRDELTSRSFQSKCITGKATSEREKSPKISCDNSKGVKKTSIKKFQVSPEFDCDLEFHYTMPDNSICKHRSPCKASGTIVENTQCGGATDVTVVYPKQPQKPKDTCDFGIHHIDFDCEGPKPSKPSKPDTPSSTPASSSVIASSSSIVASSSSVVVSSSSSYPASSPSESSSFAASSSASASESVSSASSTVASSTSSVPVESPSTSSAPTLPFPIVNSTTSATQAVSSTADVSSSAFSVTSYLSISTVFTTSVHTITSCGPSVPNCPAGSNTVVTVTVPLSTTLTPVTETLGLSTPATKPTESAAQPTESAVESTSAVPSATSSTPGSSSSTTPAGPVETLPYPNVVPSCLNTWMFSVGCKDNTDSACYCPDAAFVKNIFTCLYAYGESDEVISEAISYFQGICAPFVPSNPGIATGAETITTILTATPTALPAAVTTIEVATTVVVPCTNDVGEIIPSSSSTVTISTSLTVPDIGFSTATNGPSSTGVVIVPGTYVHSAPVATATPTPATPATPAAPVSNANPTGPAPYPTFGGSTTLITAAPSGTGVLYPTAGGSSTAIVTAGAAHVGAGIGFLGFAGMVVAAAL